MLCPQTDGFAALISGESGSGIEREAPASSPSKPSGLRNLLRRAAVGVTAFAAVLTPAALAANARAATLGKTTVGATCSSLRTDYKRVNEYSLTASGTVSSMSVWLQPGSASGSETVEGLIYGDNHGAPGALEGTTRPLTFSSKAAAGWQNLTFASAPVVPAGNHWLGIVTGGTANVAAYCYDTGAATARAANANTYANGPSNPFGTAAYDSQLMPVYATYGTVAAQQPSAPTALTATGGDRQVTLAWTASTESGGTVTGYDVFRNGAQVATVSSPGYVDSGLTDGATYTYYVTAVDAHGTTSPASATASASPAAAVTGSCATSGMVWCGDFGSSSVSQYTQILGQPASRITFPTSPTINGGHSARFELRPGDLWTDGTSRMQLRKAGWGEGTDLYFHVALYIDPSTTIGGNFSNPWRALFTWPTSEDGTCSTGGFGLYNSDSAGNPSPSGTPALTMNGDGGNCGANNVNYWRLFNPVKGAWYQFIVHRKFSYNASTGFFEFWLQKPGESTYTKQTFNNGSQRMTMRTIGCSGCSDNMRVGLYRNHLFGTTDVVYYNGIRAASSFAAAQ